MEKRIILQSIEPLLRNNYALKLIWNELVQTQIGKKKKKSFRLRIQIPPSSQCFSTGVVYLTFCHWNLQFLSHVTIIKTKVLLPQAKVTLAKFGYHT